MSSQAQAVASLSDSGMLSPAQASLHRNVGSSGGQQRPPSQGNAGQYCYISLFFSLTTTDSTSMVVKIQIFIHQFHSCSSRYNFLHICLICDMFAMGLFASSL